jgi:hypothetical protein
VRDFGPANDRFGSFTSDAVEGTRACMSAVAQKRTNRGQSRYVRLVPKADIRIAAKSSYSITSSARASNVGGISKPIALAALRLITSSNFVGWTTGRVAGFSPLRRRPA